jgi:hypothetical protein
MRLTRIAVLVAFLVASVVLAVELWEQRGPGSAAQADLALKVFLVPWLVFAVPSSIIFLLDVADEVGRRPFSFKHFVTRRSTVFAILVTLCFVIAYAWPAPT